MLIYRQGSGNGFGAPLRKALRGKSSSNCNDEEKSLRRKSKKSLKGKIFIIGLDFLLFPQHSCVVYGSVSLINTITFLLEV